jgi:hypothetical protein
MVGGAEEEIETEVAVESRRESKRITEIAGIAVEVGAGVELGTGTQTGAGARARATAGAGAGAGMNAGGADAAAKVLVVEKGDDIEAASVKKAAAKQT